MLRTSLFLDTQWSVIRTTIGNADFCRGKKAKLICWTYLTASVIDRGTLHDDSPAEAGKPFRAPQFMNWNILVREMIQVLE